MKRQLFTIGTGRATQEAFVARLRLELPERTMIYDIRRFQCGSRNGKWCAQGHIEYTIGKALMFYRDAHTFANSFGNSKGGFDIYGKFQRVSYGFPLLVKDIQGHGEASCLLCSEGKAYKKGGAPNCHRVILADLLIADLGEGWEMCHL